MNEDRYYYNLGKLFKKFKKYDQAIEYFEIASKYNHYDSHYQIGLIHHNKSNYTEAKKWFENAARQDHLESLYVLGCMSLWGNVRNCKGNGMNLLKTLPSKDNAEAMYRMGLKFYHGSTDLMRNAATAEILYIKAANNGHLKAQLALGNMYYLFHHEHEEAIKWYDKAVKQGHNKAKIQIRLINLRISEWNSWQN